MTFAIAILLAVVVAALLALVLRGRRVAAARAAAAEEAASLAEALAASAAVGAFTLRVARDGQFSTATVLGGLHAWLGYQDDETSPREAWRRLVQPEDRPLVEQALRQALAGEPAEADVRFVPARGEPRSIRLALRPVRDRWGWVHAVHGVLRERPERPEVEAELAAARRRLAETEAAEEALRLSEERVRLAIEGSGMATWDADLATGEMTLSPELAATVGLALPPDGRIRIDDWMGRVHPDDQAVMQAAVASAQREGSRYAATFRVVRSDGSAVWLSQSGRILPREGEGSGRWVGVSFDVTERVRLDEQMRVHTAELAASAALLDGAFGYAPLPMIYLDRDFRLLRVNPAAARRLGIAPEVMVGRAAGEAAPDIWRLLGPQVQGVLDRGEPVVDVEVTLHGARGERAEGRTYLASIYPVRGPGGGITGIGAFANDITERKQFEEALRASERYLSDLAEAMPQIVFILGTDLHCEYVNRRFAEFTGLLARDHESLRECVHPDDWTQVRQRWLAALQSGVPHADEARLREAATGDYRWFLLRTEPQRDAEGRITRWFGTATDIHDQKRFQRALQRAEARQRAVADAAVRVTSSLSLTKPLPETLRLVTDLGREIVGAREAVLSALPGAEGTYGLRIEARDDAVGASPASADGALVVPISGRDGRPLGTLQFADRPDGAFGAEDEAVAVQMATMAAVALENSDLVQTIREQDQRKDQFLATLAHELRNPLAPIANSLELLRHAGRDEQVLRRARGTMERQMGQMVHLIDDLLDASRISRGKLSLRRERVALQEVVQHALEATRPALERAGQALHVLLPEAPVWLDADPTRLTQVFSNLLDNAAKFSERGGRVTVAAEPGEGRVSVVVRDTGVGIPPDKLAGIFEMFSQVDQSIERSAGGLGIGLALVRGLVEMHGGRIEAASAGAGGGTEMRVTLPLAAGEPAKAPPPAEAAPARAHRRILVADDNQDSADSLVTLLQMAGHEAHAVYDGAAAIEAAARLQPDVVLLDLGMPRVSGHEAALRIREGPAQHAALVALTGWGDERTRQRTREEGFDAHLTKPVDFQELLAVVTRT